MYVIQIPIVSNNIEIKYEKETDNITLKWEDAQEGRKGGRERGRAIKPIKSIKSKIFFKGQQFRQKFDLLLESNSGTWNGDNVARLRILSQRVTIQLNLC